jgi:Cu2+-containing amine oxidase
MGLLQIRQSCLKLRLTCGAPQVDAVALPTSDANPYGNAFTYKETELLYEKGACQQAAGSLHRVISWHNVLPGAPHAVLQ